MRLNVVSLVLTPLYGPGVKRALLVFTVGGPLIVCSLANLAHGDRIRVGKGLVEQNAMLEMANKLDRVHQKVVKTMQPAPGLAKVYTPTIGSSGALMPPFSLLAVALPSKKIGVSPQPFPLSVRVLWGGLVVSDVLGAMGSFR